MARGGAESAKYVYGVIPADSRARPKGSGIGGKALSLVASGELAAITSEVPEGPLEAGRDELMAHSQVLAETLDTARAVLPMRFGVVMPSDDSVREELLDAFRPDLEAQLDEMDGKIEMNLKGIYDEAAVLREVVAENREIAGLREAIASAPPDAMYPERIRIGELVAGALNAKRESDEQAILDRLAPNAIAMDVNPPLLERMAVNAAFLLERNDTGSFDAELERLAEEQHPRIGFKLTGPLPPHSFVELALEA
jgi:hypothetical protein